MRDINYVTKTLAKRHKNIDEKDIIKIYHFYWKGIQETMKEMDETNLYINNLGSIVAPHVFVNRTIQAMIARIRQVKSDKFKNIFYLPILKKALKLRNKTSRIYYERINRQDLERKIKNSQRDSECS
jgi:hypothetical protein